MPSYRLGELARVLGIAFRGTAHRAEADAEVAARLLMHIGRHLDNSYGLGPVAPALLVEINRMAAARVHDYIGDYAAARKRQR
jgi:DNA polymerase-3 subunit epsilon